MRVLILSCNTGGGHNAVAAALAESFRRLGVSSDTADGLGFISKKASRFVSKWHTRFYRRYPKLYKAGYMSAESDAESNDRDNMVYRYMARGARRLNRAIQDGGYDAVVCVHVIPAMMMTELRRQREDGPVFCFVATDYTCSPTVGGCTPDICVIPHEELAEEFVSCGMPVVMVGSALGVFAYVTGSAIYAPYLLIPHIPGAGELLVFCGAMAGACLAFLWFNAHPAQIFMGDVGALALGGALGTIAVIVRQEIVLAIMGGIFVVEVLSVMLQVSYFKYSKKRYGEGRRIFKMAPLHHHFEKSGWAETQVVIRFWIITMLLCLVGLSTLKLR